MKKSTLYQHNTYGSLSGGVYDGSLTLSELLKHGQNGIGTLDAANGETIIVDGVVYHALSDGTVRVAELTELTPYSAVFEQGDTFELTDLSQLTDKTKIYTVRADGHFKSVTVGNKPKQEKPYTQSYADILASQPQFQAENIEGTLVGVFSPDGYEAIAGHGFHLHFISRDRTFGGHIVSYEAAEEVIFKLSAVNELVQTFAD